MKTVALLAAALGKKKGAWEKDVRKPNLAKRFRGDITQRGSRGLEEGEGWGEDHHNLSSVWYVLSKAVIS